MRRKLSKISLVVIICMLVSSSCLAKEREAKQIFQPNILFEYKKIDEGIKHISYLQPVISNHSNVKLQQKMNNKIGKTIVNSLELKEATEYYSSTSVFTEMTKNKDGILSFYYTTCFYVKGTAHPMSDCKSLNIDVNTGKTLKLYDYISKKEIYQAIKDKKGKITYGFNGIEEEVTQEELLEDFFAYRNGKEQDWFLTNNTIGLIIYFPYSTGGHTTIEIPLKKGEKRAYYMDNEKKPYRIRMYTQDSDSKKMRVHRIYPEIAGYKNYKFENKIDELILKELKKSEKKIGNGKKSVLATKMEYKKTVGTTSFAFYYKMKDEKNQSSKTCRTLNLNIRDKKKEKLSKFATKKELLKMVEKGNYTIKRGKQKKDKEQIKKDIQKYFYKRSSLEDDWYITDDSIGLIISDFDNKNDYGIIEVKRSTKK